MPPNQKDPGGNTALLAASFNGHVEIMRRLIDAGADVNLPGAGGATPLIAACGPYPEAVRLLLEAGADANVADTNEQFTALMYAATDGLSPIVDILLKNGADPSIKDVDGDTAADFARRRGFNALADRIQALIDAK
jgi:ankyrin repeat protein